MFTAHAPDSATDVKYLVGLVGDARSLASFWSMLKAGIDQDDTLQSGLSQLGIQAAALPEADTPPKKLDMGIGVPVYAGFREMLYVHPDINLVLETTGDPALIKTLRKLLPASITLVERAAASFFINFITAGEKCTACKVDHQHTQTMLTTVTDQLKEDILFLDASGTVLNANQTLCNRLNLSKRKVVGKGFREFFTGLGRTDSPFEKALKTRKPAEAVTNQVSPDGRMRYFRIYMYPIFYGGQISRMVAIRRDITDRTELEQRLAQSRKLASIGELSSYIAHEIRNPLFTIAGFANGLLRKCTNDDTAKEKLEIIVEESGRLDDIVTALIGFTRPVTGHDVPTALNKTVHLAIHAMGLEEQWPQVELDLAMAEELPWVAVDPEIMRQCIVHLLKNGVEAMEGEGTLSVTTALVDGRIRLAVADTGQGIPEQLRAEVFSPFFSTRGRGAGLGLAMTRKLMDDAGGEVELTSTEGCGTTVTLTLPPVMAVAQNDQTA